MITFNGSRWGITPEFFSLVPGAFNSRPPQPSYCFVSNVQTVINFIKSEWGKNEDLSDEYLTYKLTMLFAMTSASKVLGLQHLDIRFMTKGTNNDKSTFGKLHKAWRKGNTPPSQEKLYTFSLNIKSWVGRKFCDRHFRKRFLQ